MNVGEIITLERESILDDPTEPYRWSLSELVFDLNEAIKELTRECWLITDYSSSFTQIKLVSNLGIYALDDRIVNIKSARLSTNSVTPLTKTSEDKLDKTRYNWRNATGTPSEYAPDAATSYISVYPKFDDVGEVIGSSNISFAAGTHKISQVGATFTTDFAIGDSILIDGTTSNDGYVTVTLVTATEITVSETLVDESNTSATLRKVRDTMIMVVNRIPLTDLSASALTASPEIKSMWHGGLLDGIAKRAFLKHDSECLDKQKAEHHRGLFEAFKSKIKRDILNLTMIEDTNGVKEGFI